MSVDSTDTRVMRPADLSDPGRSWEGERARLFHRPTQRPMRREPGAHRAPEVFDPNALPGERPTGYISRVDVGPQWPLWRRLVTAVTQVVRNVRARCGGPR